LAGFIIVATTAACGGASADPGTSALMFIEGAQFVPGAMPNDSGGPKITSIDLARTTIVPGVLGSALRGTMEETATGVAIGMEGDAGYWTVPAGAPAFETPGLYTFSVSLAFALRLQPGELSVDARAVSKDGRFGAKSSVMVAAVTSSVSKDPLVISLRWDTESDLDLHVVDPNGVEIWARNISSAPRPPVGAPPDPNAQAMAGMLDFDSNAMCVIDGRRVENVIYRGTPPPGHYLVRVDTFSLCGQPAAHWSVEASRLGTTFARASGVSTDFDTRGTHDRGSGVLALDFDQP
jgi:hypothetical protein